MSLIDMVRGVAGAVAGDGERGSADKAPPPAAAIAVARKGWYSAQALADIGGSGGISDAQASGLGELIAALTGLGTVDATLTGTGELTADLVVTGTGLTTSNVGQAVWAALAAANNGTGTMGEKLNDAGSGSNPWTEVIESGFTAAQILRLLAAHAAGAATGLESGNPQFIGLDGSTVRIDGTYSGGTRSIDALDGD